MKIEILNQGQVVDTRDLSEGNYKIGRASDCEILLKSTRLSKHHAMLVIKGERAAIVDTGSSNGVFVNGILVKKQRIDLGDEVGLAEFKLRIARPQRAKASAGGRRAAGMGNLAPMDENHEGAPATAPAPQTPQEKLVAVMDEKVLLPFYALLKQVDWRMLLGGVLVGSLILSVLLSVLPFIHWGHKITSQESLERAHTIIAQTVRENYRVLSKSNDFTRLTVEAAEAEKGILSVFVIDPKSSTVLAPAKHFNKSLTEVYAQIALRRIQEGKEDRVSVQKNGNEYIVAQPIYLYTQESNDRSLVAVVLANFLVAEGVSSTFEPTVEAALFSVLLSLLAFYFISKMFTYPISRMHDQLDAALKGEDVSITSEAKMLELETLATVINFAVSRVKSGGGLSQPVSAIDGETDDRIYEASVQEFDVGTSDGLLLLSKENLVRFVGRALEEMLGMRNQYAVGQNISDACRDQSFAGTSLDLSDRVRQSLGAVQVAQLDINGIARSMTAVAHKNSSGEISHVLITIKLGGG